MGKKPAIKIENLHYGYRGNWGYQRSPALHDINLEVFEGEAFGFLGQNGAGKTTTIKCILNLLVPTAGSVDIFMLPSDCLS